MINNLITIPDYIACQPTFVKRFWLLETLFVKKSCEEKWNRRSQQKKFGCKNLNSTHFKTFVKNHVKKNETEEVIISEINERRWGEMTQRKTIVDGEEKWNRRSHHQWITTCCEQVQCLWMSNVVNSLTLGKYKYNILRLLW